MSEECRQTELKEKTQQLLRGSLKHARVAALAAALVPLASVASSAGGFQQIQPSGGALVTVNATCNNYSLSVKGFGLSAGQTGTVTYTIAIPNSSPPTNITGSIPITADSTGNFTATVTGSFGLVLTNPAQLTGTAVLSVGSFTSAPVSITFLVPSACAVPPAAVPTPCDFVTSGGFVLTDSLPPLNRMANFGAHGGCKLGGFWGHVNYVDHSTEYHVNSVEITGYLTPFPGSNIRDVCGTATTNRATDPQPVLFRVRLIDNGQPGIASLFGIRLSTGYVVTTRLLNAGMGGGGDVMLHKDNPSTFGPNPLPTEQMMCGGVQAP